jgi:hypothetical protein
MALVSELELELVPESLVFDDKTMAACDGPMASEFVGGSGGRVKVKSTWER